MVPSILAQAQLHHSYKLHEHYDILHLCRGKTVLWAVDPTMYQDMAVLLSHVNRVPWIYVDLVDAEVTLSQLFWLSECKFYPILFDLSSSISR